MFKKIISLFLILSIVFLSACNTKTDIEETSTTETTSLEEKTDSHSEDLSTTDNKSIVETTIASSVKESSSTVLSTEQAEITTKSKTYVSKKYIGDWYANYIGDGIFDYNITITSVKDNKVTLDLFFYRICNFDNQTIEVNEEGIAKFDFYTEFGNVRIMGIMKFLNNKIEMYCNENSSETYKSKTFVFQKIGGTSPYNIFNYIGENLETVVRKFGDGNTDYYAGGKFLNCNSVKACFFYDHSSKNQTVFTIMAYGNYDYGFGLTCGKTYPELKKTLAKYVDLEEPTGFYSDEDGIYMYTVGPFYIDGQYISIEWYDDPYTSGAKTIIFNGKI